MTVEFKLPDLAEGIKSAEIAEMYVAEGDEVTAGQIVMDLATEKAIMPLPCPHTGKLSKLLVKTGDTIHVGNPIFLLEGVSTQPNRNGGAESATAAKSSSVATPAVAAPVKTTAPAKTASTDDSHKMVAAGPATRRLARELGVSLLAVSGTGPKGRITQEDVARAHAGQNGSGGGLVIPPLPDFSQYGTIEKRALTKLERTSAQNLTHAWQMIPHVTQFDHADITDLEAARKEYVANQGKNGPKVTMTAVMLKAIVTCLQEFPHFNASLDSKSNEIIYKKYYHLGVAVDTPNGLVVPVIRDVNQKTVLELAAELTTLAEKARNRRLELKDMMGGTFTITNLGGIGGVGFTPIVNYPEVAILGMSRSIKQLQLIEGQVLERLMLPLSLSYDHRVINGADAARFMVKLCGLLTHSFRLLIEV